MKQKAGKLVIGLLIIGVFAVAAYWSGKKTSNALAEPEHAELLKKRQAVAQDILANVNVHEGSALPDYEFFETLESKLVRLSDVVTGPTWLTFIQPDCPACLEELDHIQQVMNKTGKTKFILISNSNPLDLIDLRDHYRLTGLILHDRNSTYIDGIKVTTFPFNVLTDKDLLVRRIVPDQLKRVDFE